MKLVYDIETMGDIDREALTYSVDAVASDFAMRIMKKIECHPIYDLVVSKLPKDKTALYFQRKISIEIQPYILQMLIVRRNSQNHGVSGLGSRGIWIPLQGIFSLLREFWPREEIPIRESAKKELIYIIFSVKRVLRKAGKRLLDCWNRYWNSNNFIKISNEDTKIAVHYAEGVDLKRRSDFVWFPQSGINPKRIIVYIDRDNVYSNRKILFSESIPDYDLKKFEEWGIEWIYIVKGLLPVRRKEFWAPSKTSESACLINLEKKPSDGIGKWILSTARELLKDVHFWKAFYQTFNVKILFLPEECSPKSIAQGIAFDILGKNAGFTVGKQRSEIGDPIKTLTGCHTKDIFFSWNCRSSGHFKFPFNCVRTKVVVGHPNDATFFGRNDELKVYRRQLIENGAKFIVALFDTGHGYGLYTFSTFDMESFYRDFLNWVLKDNAVGIVIKSKKPYILKTLHNILPLLTKAESTGRCICLDKEFGRLPSDASRIADIAVGAGVSSALTEAIIAGCRGIYYHKAFPHRHEYYKWGYGHSVFDDLDQLMKAIRSYKENPDSMAEIGDWTDYLTELDPFRDGQTGQRMGDYLRWCLEAIDSGLGRDKAIENANAKYADMWGADKIASIHSHPRS